MRLSRSSSRTMSSLLSRVRLDVALPYLFFLLAASTIVVAMVVQLRFADQKSDATTTRLAGLPQDSNNWSNQDYFRALQNSHLDKLYIGGRFSVDNERNVGFTISRRMIDSGGNFAGVVVMGARLAYFRDLLQHLELGSSDSAIATSRCTAPPKRRANPTCRRSVCWCTTRMKAASFTSILNLIPGGNVRSAGRSGL